MSPPCSVFLPDVASGIIVTRCQLQRPLLFLKGFQTLFFVRHSRAFHQQFGMDLWNVGSTTQAFWRFPHWLLKLLGFGTPRADETNFDGKTTSGFHGSSDDEDVAVGFCTILGSARSLSHLPAFPIKDVGSTPTLCLPIRAVEETLALFLGLQSSGKLNTAYSSLLYLDTALSVGFWFIFCGA